MATPSFALDAGCTALVAPSLALITHSLVLVTHFLSAVTGGAGEVEPSLDDDLRWEG